jgi:hypothetical protein
MKTLPLGQKETLNRKHKMCKTKVKMDLYYGNIYVNMNMKKT